MRPAPQFEAFPQTRPARPDRSHRRRRPALPALALLLFGVLAASASGRAAAEGPSRAPESADDGIAAVAPPLLVRLYDPYRLLSRPALDRLRAEAAEAFERSGASIRFVRKDGPRVVPATLYPEIPTNWKVAPQALGVAVGEPGRPRSVFLSVEAARRALGWRGPSGSAAPGAGRPANQLGTALGRVLAHELLHTVAPDCPHTGHGLMAARFDRRILTRPGIGFDETAGRYLRRGLRAFDGAVSGTG